MATEARRRLPSVDSLLRSPAGVRASEEFGRPLVKSAIRHILATAREAAQAGAEIPDDGALLAAAVNRAARASYGVTPVINATGVVLHTGLGRAPLPKKAVQAAARAARGYSDLEIDRDTGARGRRTSRAELLINGITGAEASLVVNNNAAALMLALAALAPRKEVLVSRGELIEIGGEFRLPDILGASGSKLVEVGTTNRTRVSDFRKAVGPRTGLLLKVHPSNYRVVGFAQEASAQELAALSEKSGVPFLYDLGSGLLRHNHGIPIEEPAVENALAEGAGLVCFSGDKLLGGPQAGIIAGRADLVEKLRTHPVARAVRVDKMQVAALEAVLASYAKGTAYDELPVWRMLREPGEIVKDRAAALAYDLGGELEDITVVKSEAVGGGGSLPGFGIPSHAVRLATPDPEAFAAHLRTGRPPVFCRVEEGAVLFDLRTIDPTEIETLARVIGYAMESDGRGEDEESE